MGVFNGHQVQIAYVGAILLDHGHKSAIVIEREERHIVIGCINGIAQINGGRPLVIANFFGEEDIVSANAAMPLRNEVKGIAIARQEWRLLVVWRIDGRPDVLGLTPLAIGQQFGVVNIE